MSKTILIVDDDAVQHRILRALLSRDDYRILAAFSGEEAFEKMKSPEGGSVDLVLLDLIMRGIDGFEVLRGFREMGISCPVIVLTAQGTIDAVVAAMQAGADDFVPKPVNPQRLLVSMGNLLKLRAAAGAVRSLRREREEMLGFDDLVAFSAAMREPTALGRRAAQASIPVLLEGESGVGKEVFARAIQGSSARSGKPFVTVNCGAIPQNLVESLLFGHEKGAFTGADRRRIGKFQEADGGTLFLDEVGDLPFDMQVKLLRALQEGEIEPVGGRSPIKVDFRLISATNRPLSALAERGRFRQDLYYRLNVFPIHLPPLRERRDDIAPLAERFLTRFALEEGKRASSLDAAAARLLRRYRWPGNVRELENTVYRAVVLADGATLTIDEFPRLTATPGGGEEGDAPPRDAGNAPSQAAAKAAFEAVSEGDAEPENKAEPKDDAEDADADLSEPASTEEDAMTLEAAEKRHIARILTACDGRVTKAARLLGIGRSTLYRKIERFGLEETVR